MSLLLLIGAQALATAGEPSFSLLPRCPEGDTKEEIVVCGRRAPSYRLDPDALAEMRARDAAPTDTRNGVRDVTAVSCHDKLTKCDGTAILPLLPIARKAAEVAILAAKGEEWRDALRTRPDAYATYREEKARRKPRVRLEVGGGSRRP